MQVGQGPPLRTITSLGGRNCPWRLAWLVNMLKQVRQVELEPRKARENADRSGYVCENTWGQDTMPDDSPDNSPGGGEVGQAGRKATGGPTVKKAVTQATNPHDGMDKETPHSLIPPFLPSSRWQRQKGVDIVGDPGGSGVGLSGRNALSRAALRPAVGAPNARTRRGIAFARGHAYLAGRPGGRDGSSYQVGDHGLAFL